ncbi:RNA-directed DNA polymerase, eukaryota [Tanacetum coccineum]
MFEKYGNLVDVYVAKKKTLGGDRFGFARFKNVSNTNALEKKLATIKIGYDNIVINVARYNKVGAGVTRANKILNNSTFAPWNAGTRQNRRSYKEDVARETRNSKNEDLNFKPDIEISVEVGDLLNRCLIGTVKEIDTLSNIGHLLMAEGWYDFRIKCLGGLSILIECPSRKAVDNILSNESCWIHTWVSSLAPWREDMDPTGRLTWLKVEDIPVHAWMPEVVRKVLKHLLVLVLTKSMEALDSLIPMTINKRKFVLKISEEKHRVVVGGFSSSSSKSYEDDISWVSLTKDYSNFRVPTNDFSNFHAASYTGNCCTSPYNVTSPKKDLATAYKDTLEGVDVTLPNLGNINLENELNGDNLGLKPAFGPKQRQADGSEDDEDGNGATSKEKRDNAIKDALGVKNKITIKNNGEPGMDIKQNWLRNSFFHDKFDLVGVQESKMENINLPFIHSIWGRDVDFVFSPSIGASGGTLLVWNCNSFSKEGHLKAALWRELSSILASMDGTWILMGDFNVVRFKSERVGSVFEEKEAADFNDFIATLGLHDFQMGGRRFT